MLPHRSAVGRGALINPASRFDAVRNELDFEHLENDDLDGIDLTRPPTEYSPDDSQTVVTENDSPDVSFRYSLNPYRGCSHGCSYCYARPTHEYLGLSAGLDFETKVLVKLHAADLFRDFLARPAWLPEAITISGVTDCYQPAERRFGITRQCLAVAWEARQPVEIVTKNALVLRDLDLLAPMAAAGLVRVNVSVTTLDAELARSMEPRTSTPVARLRAIEELTSAGVSVRVLVAPLIPGLNDSEIPAILAAVSAAGAAGAGYVLLRLPLTVKPVFLDWLARCEPLRRDRIVALIQSTRGGKLNSAEFGKRMCGTGPIAEQIADLFHVFAQRYKLDARLPALNVDAFRPPRASGGQMTLF